MNFACVTLLSIVFSPVSYAQEQKLTAFPGFRHVDQASAATEPTLGRTVTLLADQDFAPWSFQGPDGRFQGLAVDLAQQACAEAGMTCDIKPVAFADLLPALERGDGQAVISGPKLDTVLADRYFLSRPYFQTLGRFAVRAGSPLSTPDIRALAGRRIGLRNNSAHARFLEAYYSRSALIAFDNQQALLEALRTGQVDAIFGDAVQLSFWLQGTASRGCCNFLGKAFVDRATFTRSLSFIMRRDAPELRIKLDAALDRLETNGKIADVFARYLPASLW